MFLLLNKKATIGGQSQVGGGKTSKVRAALLDLRHIVLTLASHPTHVSELVEYEPELAGTGYNVQPAVWRIERPKDMVELYPTKKLTNSDLKMAALLLQYLEAEQIRPIDHCHTVI